MPHRMFWMGLLFLCSCSDFKGKIENEITANLESGQWYAKNVASPSGQTNLTLKGTSSELTLFNRSNMLFSDDYFLLCKNIGGGENVITMIGKFKLSYNTLELEPLITCGEQAAHITMSLQVHKDDQKILQATGANFSMELRNLGDKAPLADFTGDMECYDPGTEVFKTFDSFLTEKEIAKHKETFLEKGIVE